MRIKTTKLSQLYDAYGRKISKMACNMAFMVVDMSPTLVYSVQYALNWSVANTSGRKPSQIASKMPSMDMSMSPTSAFSVQAARTWVAVTKWTLGNAVSFGVLTSWVVDGQNNQPVVMF